MAFSIFKSLTVLRFLDNDGRTRILAISLTRHQDESSFAWVFEKFKNLFGIPKIMFTDQDAAMKVSISKTFDLLDIFFFFW